MNLFIRSVLIFIVCLLLILNLGLFFDKTTNPVSSDIIVSLGGDNSEGRIKKAVKLYENNFSLSNKIILTGVTRIDKRITYLISKKIKKENIIFNYTAKNTFEEITFIKKYLLKHHMKTVLVVSDPPHSRRILFFANTMLKYPDSNLSIRVIASKNNWWNAKTYYTNYKAIRFVSHESIKLIYYYVQYLLRPLHNLCNTKTNKNSV
jgi:uncharacterized SAM-binding protein YcdF (DUF218 family)